VTVSWHKVTIVVRVTGNAQNVDLALSHKLAWIDGHAEKC
jgi:hypothetical protein